MIDSLFCIAIVAIEVSISLVWSIWNYGIFMYDSSHLIDPRLAYLLLIQAKLFHVL